MNSVNHKDCREPDKQFICMQCFKQCCLNCKQFHKCISIALHNQLRGQQYSEDIARAVQVEWLILLQSETQQILDDNICEGAKCLEKIKARLIEEMKEPVTLKEYINYLYKQNGSDEKEKEFQQMGEEMIKKI